MRLTPATPDNCRSIGIVTSRSTPSAVMPGTVSSIQMTNEADSAITEAGKQKRQLTHKDKMIRTI
ncbi:hypothetical protein LNV07_18435 [Paucibacter oligotrophus]|uniref:Uncharacterized protein n=1 Tax=Roseateles oligotrophus TaxID=1769250 RepID=A0ABT2YJ31_9BURK|nr:hypothetical protein [Roseateles oligotrophus]MCV2370064.1 hypothetical protein [Roseateles oligotrophus]